MSPIRTISVAEGPGGNGSISDPMEALPSPAADEQAFDPNIHPLMRPAMREFVASAFPQYVEALDTMAQPTVSSRPDEMEQWEDAQILRRRSTPQHGNQGLELYRLLYEESFGVNQNPGLANPPALHGSAGMTPGGLISHHYPNVIYAGHDVADLAQMPELDEPTVGAAFRRLRAERPGSITNEAAAAFAVTISNVATRQPLGGMQDRFALERQLREGEPANERLQTIGYRFLQMLHTAPEMLEPVEDKSLQARFVLRSDDMPRATLLFMAWKDANRRLPGDAFPNEYTDEVAAATEQLLALRTHPEMQVFYTYLSPSGYVNEANAA